MSEKNSKYPKKYKQSEIEQKWRQHWDESGIYNWDPRVSREDTFVVDTPPPTVSGSLHVGHAYSYAQTDVLVRFQRMLGKNIFYPMGWDDNGLPTERRAQNVFNIRCEPHLKYDPHWSPRKKNKKTEIISRRNFIEACEEITREDEVAFENTWRKLGLSVDWSQVYTTIDSHCRHISQLSFLDLIKKGMVYNTESITMWDVDFKTAVSQAEVEDREITGAYHDLRFAVEDGTEFIISTTRPELLPACIAVAAHPDDTRFQEFFGKNAITPLFKTPVPIVASEHADPEKGSGILMICTFGDFADVEWWRGSGLPSRQVIGLDGKFFQINFDGTGFSSTDPAGAQQAYDQLVGLNVKKARKKIIELLSLPGSSGNSSSPALAGEPRPVTHPVRFYEKGDRPLEFIPTRQWFIKILDYKDQLLEQGKKIKWHPEYMQTRYDHWVMGLNQEWCISRQRYFGVPLPVWYPVKANGQPDYDSPVFPEPASLPVDPLTDTPPGFTEDQREKAGGFTGEADVMDTWGTSSMTPQISSHWGIDPQRHARLFPADLRPQAHDIIRTWAFYTITKAWMHEEQVPWHHAAISGFILDPDRKKMSKSKGNVVTPESLLDEHSSDVFRYWASRGRLGVDSSFDETLFKIGRKLVIKLFNASKFVLMQIDQAREAGHKLAPQQITCEPDRGWAAILQHTVQEATRSLQNYDYTTALQITEDTFWNFCDNYLELVKAKAYQAGENEASLSALATLDWSLKTFLRLFAPFIPFITEEIWSWNYTDVSSFIHTAPWPAKDDMSMVQNPEFPLSFEFATEVISKIRGHKTLARTSLKTPVNVLKIKGTSQDLAALEPVLPYIIDVAVAENPPELIRVDETGSDEEHFILDIELGDPPVKVKKN